MVSGAKALNIIKDTIVLVVKASGSHLIPSRTQKLSPIALMILGPEPWESRSPPEQWCFLIGEMASWPFFCFVVE